MADSLRRPPRRGHLVSNRLVAVEYRPRFYSDSRPWQLKAEGVPHPARYPSNEVRED